jgi:hypothetical protein
MMTWLFSPETPSDGPRCAEPVEAAGRHGILDLRELHLGVELAIEDLRLDAQLSGRVRDALPHGLVEAVLTGGREERDTRGVVVLSQ